MFILPKQQETNFEYLTQLPGIIWGQVINPGASKLLIFHPRVPPRDSPVDYVDSRLQGRSGDFGNFGVLEPLTGWDWKVSDQFCCLSRCCRIWLKIKRRLIERLESESFSKKKHVSFFGELFWLKISKLATANVRELHFRKQSFLRSHFPEESLYFNPHKLAMFDPRRSHTRLWSWLKRCLEAGEWFKEVGSLKAFSERLPKIHMFFSWFKEIQGDSIWWMFCHLSKRGLWSVISEALALRLELEAPPLEEVGGWSIDLNRSSLNKNRNKFQGRRFVITQNQRRGRIYTFQKCFCFRSRSQISSFS